jgi:hypothetical protein
MKRIFMVLDARLQCIEAGVEKIILNAPLIYSLKVLAEKNTDDILEAYHFVKSDRHYKVCLLGGGKVGGENVLELLDA